MDGYGVSQDLRVFCGCDGREHNTRNMRSTAVIPILVLMTGFVGFAQQPTSKIIPLRSRIPAAKPEKYRDLRDAVKWKNPYFIIQADGVQVWINGAALTGPTMPVPDVIGYLEKLPNRSWFYGLVVGVQENSLTASNDPDRSITNRNFSELLQRLKDAGVRAELWPSG